MRYKCKTPGCSDGYSLSSMDMRVDSADLVYLGSSVGFPGPDDVSNLVADIAEWYMNNPDYEEERRLSRSYVSRDGYGGIVISF